MNTGSNATLLLTTPESRMHSGYVRAYAEDDRCVGQADLNAGEKLVLSIWGDDPYSPEKDGLLEGESFTLEFVGTDRNLDPIELVLQFTLDQGEPYYATHPTFSENAIFKVDSLYVDKIVSADCSDASEVASDFTSFGIYPNPAKQFTRLEFTAPKGSVVSLASYDLLGRLVSTIHETESARGGEQSIRWDASGLASGAYVVRLETSCGIEDRVIHILN